MADTHTALLHPTSLSWLLPLFRRPSLLPMGNAHPGLHHLIHALCYAGHHICKDYPSKLAVSEVVQTNL